MKKIFILIVPLLFMNIACENETSETKINNVSFENLKVKDSRLYFENKEEFKFFLERIDKMPENLVMTEINKNMYSKDFYSLMPIINEKNIEQINTYQYNKIQIGKNKYFDRQPRYY